MTERHEFRHHLETIRALLVEEKKDRLNKYLDGILQSTAQPLQYSKHFLTNALVTPRLKKAQTLGVKLSVSIQVPERLAMDDADLSVLLSNLLDNAVEAIAQIPGVVQ